MSTDNPQLDAALLDAFRDLPTEDQRELAKFVDLLNRRAAHPDEPPIHSYAEVYGDVVFEDKASQQSSNAQDGGNRGE